MKAAGNMLITALQVIQAVICCAYLRTQVQAMDMICRCVIGRRENKLVREFFNMSKLTEANKKIEETVTGAYNAIENGVVGAYKKVEDSVVGAYKKVEEKCVETLFAKDGETVEEAKTRLRAAGEQNNK